MVAVVSNSLIIENGTDGGVVTGGNIGSVARGVVTVAKRGRATVVRNCIKLIELYIRIGKAHFPLLRGQTPRL